MSQDKGEDSLPKSEGRTRVFVVRQLPGEACEVPGPANSPARRARSSRPSGSQADRALGQLPAPTLAWARGFFSLPGTCVPHTHRFCFQVCGWANGTELLETTQASAVCRSTFLPSSLGCPEESTCPGQKPSEGAARGTQGGHEGHSPSGAGQGAQESMGPYQGLAGAHRPGPGAPLDTPHLPDHTSPRPAPQFPWRSSLPSTTEKNGQLPPTSQGCSREESTWCILTSPWAPSGRGWLVPWASAPEPPLPGVPWGRRVVQQDTGQVNCFHFLGK